MPIKPVTIPYPLSSFPGANPQESAGRLINCYAEPLGEGGRGGPSPQVWRRSAGLSQHAATTEQGYRGGLLVNNLSFEAWANNASTVDTNGVVTSLGNLPGTKKISIARDQAGATPDVVAVDLDNGAYVLQAQPVVAATATATIGGTVFDNGDTVALTFNNSQVSGLPVAITYAVGAGSSASIIAAGLVALINANATLGAANISAANVAAVITISHKGLIGNSTTLEEAVTGSGNETVTFNPGTGQLGGGSGVAGVWGGGAPQAYNGQGNLPQPCSVCFQDGYFFFMIADCRVFASGLNILTQNALTFITANAKSDVVGQRCIAFSGVLLLFTSGHCEVWQDNALAAPNFPYARLVVLEFGLVQPTAIAGWETGFSELLWVAQDFGVYWMTPGSLAPQKVSPPDLDRFIQAQVKVGNTIEAGCYSIGGKKFWRIDAPGGSWEINVATKRWNERSSWSAGTYTRTRATCGHPAFGKWLVGDQTSGNLLYIDDQNYTENGGILLFRMESGPVLEFPQQQVIARADFNFDMGTGIVQGNYQMTVSGAASGTNGVVRLTVNNTAQANTGDEAIVSGVEGTVEANGTWPITVIDGSHIELVGSVYANAYTGGGVAVDVTVPVQAINPQVAISFSKSGGATWGNPLVRALGPQGKIKRSRASVKHCGQGGPMGVRWRIDVTAPVYVGFLGATQSSDPREVGP